MQFYGNPKDILLTQASFKLEKRKKIRLILSLTREEKNKLLEFSNRFPFSLPFLHVLLFITH